MGYYPSVKKDEIYFVITLMELQYSSINKIRKEKNISNFMYFIIKGRNIGMQHTMAHENKTLDSDEIIAVTIVREK